MNAISPCASTFNGMHREALHDDKQRFRHINDQIVAKLQHPLTHVLIPQCPHTHPLHNHYREDFPDILPPHCPLQIEEALQNFDREKVAEYIDYIEHVEKIFCGQATSPSMSKHVLICPIDVHIRTY